MKPIGVAHHGNRTGDAFHPGKPYGPEKIRDYVKLKDLGLFGRTCRRA